MMDAIVWRDLHIVNLLVCELGSTIFATLSRASCMAIIVTAGVSSIFLVFHPSGALSLCTHSVFDVA